ncbi:MAG TPA: autotransporter assembly complex family protein [Pinirhizobacter sp.]|uniref:autotransporter assembly complex protein TamA n=1 Tax=Pinirhizobacter sp. TaxID=2950432 RepID=UPI002C2B5617|nr:autotransporter assembly complex family protein [Pinirhizobacter sp.]HMH68687.1 autotransporter assembly complex family protein [Pinirhizobacter sp.]
MRRTIRPFCLAAALLLLPAWAHAAVRLVVDGVDDTLKPAVINAVALSQYTSRDVTAAQVRRLYEQAPDQVREGLKPYGYYEAEVTGDIAQEGNNWRVTLHVKANTPVKITEVNVSIDDTVARLPRIRGAVTGVKNLKGQVMDDGVYEGARDRVGAMLTSSGYLDARLTRHTVEITRAEHAAVITLAWETGQRYRIGHIAFKGSQFRDGFLDRYLPFHEGDYFSQDQLLQLQQALNGADYFSVVNVMPDIDNAKNGEVNVNVELAPAPRTIYTGGPFIGTDTGVGLRGGIEKRWVNDRGHKWKNEIVAAQRLKTLTSLYTIPMPGPDQRSFNFGATFRDADTTTSTAHTLELVANETKLWHGWTRVIGVHALTGTFTVGKKGGETDNTIGIEHGRSTLLYPEISLSRKSGDNPIFVRRGWSVTLTARSTVGTVLSSTSFTQFLADGKWIRSFAGNNRWIVRGTAGYTTTKDFSDLPPQLRFFAGGDRSVRGYGFESLGPRNDFDRVIGGKNLLVASNEVEHYFTRNWGMAAFVDAGNAFSGTDIRPAIGAGLGVRWLSPVGMIRVDVGTPIRNDREHGIQLHVVIGPDL